MSAFLPIEALSSLSQQAQAMLSAANAQGSQGMSVAGGDQAAASSPTAPDGFARMVSDGLSKVNDQLIGSQVDLQKLAMGDAQNLHQIMINLEESRLSFQLMMQVRSRLLEAYQDVMKMPV